MNEIWRFVVIILILILFFSLRIFLAYKFYKKKGFEYFKKDLIFGLRIFIITIICIIIIVLIYNLLPKYETGIDINIKNNNIVTEININGDYYYLSENIENIHINKNRGFIAIKTENKNKIVYYYNNKSIFSFDKKINIIINNEEIKIESIFINITKFIDNIEKNENYNNILELLIKNK
jgi:hypothetical protein